MASQTTDARRWILFTPINSAGHINASLAIADRLWRDHNYHCVFLLTGPYLDKSIEQHGHELITIEDLQPYEDYELEPGEDPNEPVDEARKMAEGKIKRRFVGAFKWPQMILRRERDFQLDPLESIEHRADMLCRITVDCLSNSEQQVGKIIERLQPDLIVADVHFPPACVLLNEQTRPWVKIHTANPMVCCESSSKLEAGGGGGGIRPPAICGCKLYTREERELMRSRDPEKWASILGEWKRAQDKVESTMARALEPVRDWYAGHSEHLRSRLAPGKASISSAHLNIYLYPKALDYDQEDDLFEYPARWLRCESLLRHSANSTFELREETRWRRLLEENMSGKQTMIFFSLGSIASANFKLMQRYVEFLSEDARATTSGRLYVVSKGVNGDKYELAKCNMIGDNYLPQALLLQHAQLAIVHGGNNTITECLHYGVPMIVMPNFADQLDNAQRIEDLRLGKRLDLFKCTRDDLLGTIDKLLDDRALIERVRTIGKRMQTLDELGKVSQVIRSLVERGYLDEATSERYAIKLTR